MNTLRNETPRPLGWPASAYGALVVMIILLTTAALAIWDFLVAQRVTSGTAWVPWAVQHLDGLRAAAWMLPAGILAGALGLWLLWLAVKPRPVLAVPADGNILWVYPKVLAALAQAAVREVSGTVRVKVRATPRRITISAAGRGTSPQSLEDTLRQRVEQRLAGLADPPTVKVTVRPEGDSP